MRAGGLTEPRWVSAPQHSPQHPLGAGVRVPSPGCGEAGAGRPQGSPEPGPGGSWSCSMGQTTVRPLPRHSRQGQAPRVPQSAETRETDPEPWEGHCSMTVPQAQEEGPRKPRAGSRDTALAWQQQSREQDKRGVMSSRHTCLRMAPEQDRGQQKVRTCSGEGQYRD